MKTFTIGWLNKCRCGNKLHTVKTARGNETALWDDDAVKCNSCGRGGVIQVCESQAHVLWETDEEMAEGKLMSTITRERVANLIEFNSEGSDCQANAEEWEVHELARIALASLEAEASSEPVAFINRAWTLVYYRPPKELRLKIGDKLYTAPPAPVSVPDEKVIGTFNAEKNELALLDKNMAVEKFAHWHVHNSLEVIARPCRAAMLQGKAEPRDHVRREHAEWSQSTFGDVGPVGPLKHLSKEALEAAAEPEDLSEWADMQFLLWDAQRRAGITDEQITQAMIDKLAVNKSRQWPEPKDGEPRLHIKPASQK